jgi:hypothetical protein
LQQRLALVTRLGPIEVAFGRQQARVELRMPPGK